MDNGESSYRRFLAGDDKGLEELVRAYKDGLILYLHGYVNNISIAEELTEDTFFRLIAKRPRFSGKCSFKTWLYAIGRHVAVDYIRHHAKISCSPIEELADELCDAYSPEEACVRDERKLTVHRALLRLSPEYRHILWLVYFDGFSNKDAAVILRKNDRQIKNLLYRARKALKSELEKEGFVYEEL